GRGARSRTMIVIVDPSFLWTAGEQGALSTDEERTLGTVVSDLVSICFKRGDRIPGADWYWGRLQREIIRPLDRRVNSPQLKRGLDTLHAHTRRFEIPERPGQGRTQIWGARVLFGWNGLHPDWLAVMERLLIGCTQLPEETVLFTRLIEGRN